MIVLGDACADVIVRTSVDEEDPKRQFRPEVICGGSSANTAMLLARLGVPVAFVVAVGRDSFGSMISDQLSGAGVDISGLIHLEGAFTTVVVALIALDGLTLAEALEWGNATGGMSLKAPGTSGVFDRDDVITLIRQQSKLTLGHTL